MRCKLSESTDNTAISLMNMSSSCCHNKKIAQSRRYGFSDHFFPVLRLTYETRSVDGQSRHQSRQLMLNSLAGRPIRRQSEISTEFDAQLQEVGEKGAELQRLADDDSPACLETQTVKTPVCKLCGKSDLLAGVALATLGIDLFA